MSRRRKAAHGLGRIMIAEGPTLTKLAEYGSGRKLIAALNESGRVGTICKAGPDPTKDHT